MTPTPEAPAAEKVDVSADLDAAVRYSNADSLSHDELIRTHALGLAISSRDVLAAYVARDVLDAADVLAVAATYEGYIRGAA
jgi:hypothetical protein